MELLNIKINKRKQTLTLTYNKGRKNRIVTTYGVDDVDKFINQDNPENVEDLIGIELLYYIILKLEVWGGIIITSDNIKFKPIKLLNEIVLEKNQTFRTDEYKNDIFYSQYMNEKL